MSALDPKNAIRMRGIRREGGKEQMAKRRVITRRVESLHAGGLKTAPQEKTAKGANVTIYVLKR